MNRCYTSIAIVMALILLTSCGTRKPVDTPSSKSFAKELQVIGDNWKGDPLGCRGIRTTALAENISEKIFDHKDSHPIYQAQVESLLGAPDYSRRVNDFYVIGYYYHAECVDDQIPDGVDFCTFEFFFETDLEPRALYEWGPVCE